MTSFLEYNGYISINGHDAKYILVSGGVKEIADFITRDSTGGIYNGSATRTNQYWFDYSWAGTGYAGSVINFSGLDGSYSTELFASYNSPDNIGIRSKQGDIGSWNEPRWLWHDKNFNPNNYATTASLSDYVDKTSHQEITGRKVFVGGNTPQSTRLLISSNDNSQNPTLGFLAGGRDWAGLNFDGGWFSFTNGSGNNEHGHYHRLRTGSLTARGAVFVDAQSGKSDFANISLAVGNSDTGFHWEQDGVISYYSNSSKLFTLNDLTKGLYGDFQVSINNGSPTRTNKFWFDYNWAGTGYLGSVINFSGLNGNYSTELFASYNEPDKIGIRTKQGDAGYWNLPRWLYHSENFGTRNNYLSSDSFSRNVVVRELTWNKYGNQHTIFDASSGISPTGAVVSNADAYHAWTPTYPMLVGYNGGATFGVKVDTSRNAENLGNISAGSFVQQSSLNNQLANYATLAGIQVFTGTNTFLQSPVIPQPTISSHAANAAWVDANFLDRINGGVMSGATRFNPFVELRFGDSSNKTSYDSREVNGKQVVHKYIETPSGYSTMQENWWDGAAYHALEMRNDGLYVDGYKIYNTANFNPSQYVQQTSLNTQLSNYATLAGTQTFTGTNSFAQSPIIPNPSLGFHAVNMDWALSYVHSYVDGNIDYKNYSDNRKITPKDLSPRKFQFGFGDYYNEANDSGEDNWADFIHFGGYQDSSGGRQNLLVFSKSFGMRQYLGDYQNDAPYSDFVEYWHSNNLNPGNFFHRNGGYIDGFTQVNADFTVKGSLRVQRSNGATFFTLGNQSNSFALNTPDGGESFKISHLAPNTPGNTSGGYRPFIHMPYVNSKVNLGMYGDQYPDHQIAIKGKMISESRIEANEGFRHNGYASADYLLTSDGGVVHQDALKNKFFEATGGTLYIPASTEQHITVKATAGTIKLPIPSECEGLKVDVLIYDIAQDVSIICNGTLITEASAGNNVVITLFSTGTNWFYNKTDLTLGY